MTRSRKRPHHRHARLRARARRVPAQAAVARQQPVLDWRALFVHGRLGPHRLADWHVQQALTWLGPPDNWTDNPFWPVWPAGTRAPKGFRVRWPVILLWGWLELHVAASGRLLLLHLDSFGPRGRPGLGSLRSVHTGLVRGGKPLAAIRRRLQRAGVVCREARDSLNWPVLHTPAGCVLSFDDDDVQAPGLGAVSWNAPESAGADHEG